MFVKKIAFFLLQAGIWDYFAVFTKVLQKIGIQTAENGVYSKDGEYVSLSLRGMFRDGIKKDSND